MHEAIWGCGVKAASEDDAQRWQPPGSKERNENRPPGRGGRRARPKAEEPRTRRHGGQGRRTHEKKQTEHRQDRRRKREAGGRQAKAGNEARRTGEPKDRQTTTTRRRASERTEARQERQKQTQPTALKIISALPDCRTLLYCCQACRIIRARSTSSASDAQERTNATVSSAGRPPASKTSGTSSPPEGG